MDSKNQSDGEKIEAEGKRRVVLSQHQAVEIFQMKHSHGYSSQHNASIKLSRNYKVSPKAIRDIWNGRSWLNVTSHLWKKEELPPRKFPGRPRGKKDSRPRKKKLNDRDSDIGHFSIDAAGNPIPDRYGNDYVAGIKCYKPFPNASRIIEPQGSKASQLQWLPNFNLQGVDSEAQTCISRSFPILAPLNTAYDIKDSDFTMAFPSAFNGANGTELISKPNGSQHVTFPGIQLPSISSFLGTPSHFHLASLHHSEAEGHRLLPPPPQNPCRIMPPHTIQVRP
jgi:hypothetical protein